uniref:Uncharacterized protein n=1 Tax=Romanomermis culicivorax TaxID=13658 RepID=A0A915IA69_ROMCU
MDNAHTLKLSADDTEASFIEIPPLGVLPNSGTAPLTNASNPYRTDGTHEMPPAPIELTDNLRSLQHKITSIQTNIALIQSVNQDPIDNCLSSKTNAVAAVLIDRDKDFRAVDIHKLKNRSLLFPSLAYRNGFDVHYQRVAVSGEDLCEELTDASDRLINALRIRKKYMQRSLQFCSTTAAKFLSGDYPNKLANDLVMNRQFSPPRYNLIYCNRNLNRIIT